MFYLVIKVVISALLIVAIGEVSKRYTAVGAILASVPLVSVLAMIWLYVDTKNTEAVAQLSRDIFWLVIPSLVLFVALPIFLTRKVNFYLSLGLSTILMLVAYFIMILLLKKL